MSFETTLPKTFPSSFNTWPCRTFQRPAGKKVGRLGWRQKNVQYRYMPQMHQKRLEDFWCMNSLYDYYIQGDHGSAQIVSTKPSRASCIRPSMSSISMSTFSWSHLTIHMSSLALWLYHLLQTKKKRSNSGSGEAPPSSWHKMWRWPNFHQHSPFIQFLKKYPVTNSTPIQILSEASAK